MKVKLIGIFVMVLLIFSSFPRTVIAGDEGDPEIKDEGFQIWDLFKRFNIISAWFINDDINLYVSIKMGCINPSSYFASTVIWTYGEGQYFASYQDNNFYFGFYNNEIYLWEYMDTTGTIDTDNNIITIVVPLLDIDINHDIQILYGTWAMTHFGLRGLNFHFPFDRAPNLGFYGDDYQII